MAKSLNLASSLIPIVPVRSEQPSVWEPIRSRSPQLSTAPGSRAAGTVKPELQHLHPDRRGVLETGSRTPRRGIKRVRVPQT